MSKGWIALFPGQGSQHVGMAKDFFESFKIVKETFEEASDACKLNLKKLCFDGPESDLTLTEFTQPALLTSSVAAFRVARSENGFSPAVVAGHSLGEYSALVAAGALPLGQAAAWVRERGAAMQRAVPAGQGTMAAIMGMDEASIDRLCKAASASAHQKRSQGENADYTVDAIVQPANFNAPGQVVIAGSGDAVAEAVALIKGGGDFAGGKAIPLSVSAPFHCSLMAPARDRMAEVFGISSAQAKPAPLSCPYVPNRTARKTSEPGVVLELLIEQIDHPVLWSQSIAGLIGEGYTQAVEFGPGKVLAGLAKRIATPLGKALPVAGVSDTASFKLFDAQFKTGGA